MPPLAALTEAAHAVLRPFGEARSLPPSAYKDPTVFEHEQTHIFDCHWLCVGREEDVSRPGQWLRAPVTPEGVLIVRDRPRPPRFLQCLQAPRLHAP